MKMSTNTCLLSAYRFWAIKDWPYWQRYWPVWIWDGWFYSIRCPESAFFHWTWSPARKKKSKFSCWDTWLFGTWNSTWNCTWFFHSPISQAFSEFPE